MTEQLSLFEVKEKIKLPNLEEDLGKAFLRTSYEDIFISNASVLKVLAIENRVYENKVATNDIIERFSKFGMLQSNDYKLMVKGWIINKDYVAKNDFDPMQYYFHISKSVKKILKDLYADK